MTSVSTEELGRMVLHYLFLQVLKWHRDAACTGALSAVHFRRHDLSQCEFMLFGLMVVCHGSRSSSLPFSSCVVRGVWSRLMNFCSQSNRDTNTQRVRGGEKGWIAAL